MKYALLVLIWGGLTAQTPQPMKGTIANLDKEPAAYVPDDSLPYSASISAREAEAATAQRVAIQFGYINALNNLAAAVATPTYYPVVIGGFGGFGYRAPSFHAPMSHAGR